MGKSVQGFTDEAAYEDLFDIRKYIEGLAKFIENCNTPMTISIQGAWGTGKTSIMQIIRNVLRENGRTQDIWFNTWQFSQFNMENELALSLLSCMLDEFSVSDEQKKEVNNITTTLRSAGKTAGKIGKELLLSLTDKTMGGRIAENLEKSLDIIQGGIEDSINPTSAIKDLREQFANCVAETLEKSGKERVVIFIDDLDRLEPRKAVELLEVLKIFLDCKNCVFVLAIDYDVVCKGVTAKYGRDISDEKGRNFFEKIIQVPFKMPVAEYNINNYVIKCFEEIGVPCPSSDVDNYIDLIKRSVGTNPRSMKRLFNAYLLLTIVVSEEILESDRNKQLLFAVLCLQHSFEKTYNYIVSNRATLTGEKLSLFVEGTKQEIEDRLNIKIDDNEADKIQPFMEKLLQVIDNDGNGEIGEDEIENFRNVLGISTITSSNDEGEGKAVRKTNEVTTLNELELGGKDIAELEAFISKIEKIGEDVTYSMRNRNNKTGHVIFKTGNGKSFADIFMRKVGFAVDCIANSREDFSGSQVNELLTKYDVNLDKTEKCVTLKVVDEGTQADCLSLLEHCYKSHMGD